MVDFALVRLLYFEEGVEHVEVGVGSQQDNLDSADLQANDLCKGKQLCGVLIEYFIVSFVCLLNIVHDLNKYIHSKGSIPAYFTA